MAQELIKPITDYPYLVDDRALKLNFLRGLEKHLNEGNTTPANLLREQLAERKTLNGRIPVHDPEKSVLPIGEIYNRGRASTLIVGNLYKCDKCDKWHASTAGGVMLTKSGLALTNHHVIAVENAATFGALGDNGIVFPVSKVLASSKKADLAVIQLEGTNFPPPVKLGKHAPVGSDVHVISHPNSDYFTHSKGTVARYYLMDKPRAPRMQITADFARGSSGCGVFNQWGHLIGLVSSTNSIYYKRDANNIKVDLQMVIKSCSPGIEILKLVND